MRAKKILGATVAAILTIGVSTGPLDAGSVAGFGGATEVTQLLNNTELIQQVALMSQQVQQAITTVNYLQQQLVNLANQPQLYWGQISSDMTQLLQVVAEGQALGYSLSNLDGQFAAKYPGFRSPLGAGYSNTAKQWTQTNLDSIKGALKVAGMQSDQFTNEQAALAAMEAQAGSSQGSLQIAQVGVQVAAQQSQQLMKLRQLMMAEMQAQNAVLATNEQRRADEQALGGQHFTTFTPSNATFSSNGGKH